MALFSRTFHVSRVLCARTGQRGFATGNIKVNQDEKTGVATMVMSKKPVNSLNLDVLTELNIAIDKLHADKTCRGLVLASDVPKIFSAGLDILEMYQPQQDRLRTFWSTLQDFWIKLYGSRLVTIAAINGNSPAGGCLLSMSCDMRLMSEGNYSIGLNETKLGIVAPFWFQDTMVNTIGHRETERALMLGHMYSADEALKVGLVDQLVAPDQMESRVAAEMSTWLKIPDGARMITKQNLRQDTINKLISRKDKDIDYFVNFITSKAAQTQMGLYLEMLKKKAQK